MVEPVELNLFKFVAVRPVQRVTEKETRRTTIRDARATNPDGVNQLARLARKLINPERAIDLWRQFNLEELDPIAEGYRELIRRYETLDAEEDTPNAQELLDEIGISVVRDQPDSRLLHLAFDALYTAERTGADAGLRLEIPMAALRVLHFAELLSKEQQPTRAAALEALTATPIIPISFHEALGRETTTSVSEPNTVSSATQPDSARSTYLRALATDLNSTERLLETVINAPALYSPPVLVGQPEEAGGWLRSEFALGTTPTLNSVFSGQLSRDEVALLNQLRVTEAVSVPIAAQTLQSHLLKLTQDAFVLADDQEFQGYMQELSAPGSIMRSNEFLVTAIAKQKDDPNNEVAPDVDVSGQIIPLGIGDLKVVKQTLLAYVPGEVAHIENVLKGESKERKHRKLDRTEVTLFTSEEETKETERDTQSTDRFELKRETELTIKEDMSIKAGLSVTASYGPVVATATGDFAYSTSMQDSAKSSSNFAREVVDRSVSKVQTKTKTERTTKTLTETEEINTHGLNNTKGDGHVTGIYRWVDKRYRAQIYNYGVRLLLEFIVPEPAAFYRASQLHKAVKGVNATPPPPFVKVAFVQPGAKALGRVGGTTPPPPPLTVGDITEANYLQYASRYNAAGITPPPPLHASVGTSLVKEGLEAGKTIGMSAEKFVVPGGYTLQYYSATVTIIWVNHAKFTLQVGKDYYPILNKNPREAASIENKTEGAPNNVTLITDAVPVSVGAYDVNAFAINIQGLCQRTNEHLVKWKLQTFDKIYAAYQALQAAYDQKVAQAEAQVGIMIEGRNPAQNRVIEKTELKKLCITMMTGQHFNQFNAMTDPPDKPKTHPEVDVYEALDEGRIVQFFEQAFEWEQMTYLLYPYFWGRKKNWVDITHLSNPDPMFAQFLTAGAARVVVPVPMAYADSVLYLLQNPHHKKELRDKVWKGGERPTIEDKDGLYLSITEELRNQTDDLNGAKPEGEPWEFTLPTTLVWLQPDATLPIF